ncbi:olfactory receptor 7A17-like [Ictidomys tridecemlineatus]|nr:olfactory receptor 7A17-like [Ictidomys tridecemlineatus]
MESENQTLAAEFLLLGLSEDSELQPILFGLFLTMYLVTVLGNLLIILTISSDPHLHTPMYFFLSSLSLADIGSTSTLVPKMLVNIQTESKAISYAGCLTQLCFFVVFVCMDNLLLAVMAYDRYVAICHPLYYTVIMNPRLCVLLVLICLLISTVDALVHTLMLLRLSFCKHLEIPHFFCDLTQIIYLSCNPDTRAQFTIDLPPFSLELLGHDIRRTAMHWALHNQCTTLGVLQVKFLGQQQHHLETW